MLYNLKKLSIFNFQLQCCGGVQGAQDWESNIYFNCSSSIELNGIDYRPVESCGVPFSCCAHGDINYDEITNTQCGYGVRSKKESQEGSSKSKSIFRKLIGVKTFGLTGVLKNSNSF